MNYLKIKCCKRLPCCRRKEDGRRMKPVATPKLQMNTTKKSTFMLTKKIIQRCCCLLRDSNSSLRKIDNISTFDLNNSDDLALLHILSLRMKGPNVGVKLNSSCMKWDADDP